MAQHEAYATLEGLNKRVPLRVDSAFTLNEDPDSSNSPDSPVPRHSPVPIHITTRPSSRGSGSEPLDLDDDREPSSGPHRSRSVSSGKSDKEKRKRSRVTPEQLVHLERFFAVDRSPTAGRRREISELLGMQERQTQIWFQNRRAKAKLQDGKQKGHGGSEISPDSPPQLSTGFEADLHNLIHEDEPVTIIPCTDLSIGTWRRIATSVGKHDLVAYVCDVKRCLTWFIHSAGFGFKMEIPFETIIDTEFTNAAPGSGLASFQLSQPPIFYLENVDDGSALRYWKRCADWTEGRQATYILRHDLIGSAVQLAHVLRNLRANTGPDIPLRHPSYRADPPTPPMELPLPPMAGLTGPGYHYEGNNTNSPPHSLRTLSRKRLSYTGPGLTTHSPDSAYSGSNDSDRALNAPNNSTLFSHHQSYAAVSHHGTPASSNFGAPMYNDYATDSQHVVGHHGHPVNDYTGISISHGLAPRPYPSQPVPRTFYNDIPRLVHPYETDDTQTRRSHSTVNVKVEDSYDHISPSPPLLTTPYHPPPHLLENMAANHTENRNSITPPIIPDIPGLPLYDAEADYRRHQDN